MPSINRESDITKYYVVLRGRMTGIFFNWEDCKKMIDRYPNAKYKSFESLDKSKKWIKESVGEIELDLDAMDELSPFDELSDELEANSSDTVKVIKHNISNGNSSKYTVICYSDGGNRNTGNIKGGHVNKKDKSAWAYYIESSSSGKSFFDTRASYGDTNNKMELTGFLKMLEHLKNEGLNNQNILAKLDSKYVLDSINKGWLNNWARNNFLKNGSLRVNAELWRDIYNLLKDFPSIQLDWVKGHATDEGNIKVDALLNKAMDNLK